MTRARASAATDGTLTSSTDTASNDATQPPRVPALAVVLEGDRLTAGGALFSLSRVTNVIIGRGATREARTDGDKAQLRLDLPDAKVSSRHAQLERTQEGYVLSDLGSSNGTYVGATRIEREIVAPGTPIRVGHTLLTLVSDAGPALARRSEDAAWPVATLSGPFARQLERLSKIAASNIPLVLLGETGTGKEVLARAVHARSGRPGAFVAVNCGALPQNLVEAQLFGHQKGAFSGALRDEPGFVRVADHGTLFLDEIGDLPPTAQASLLRVLQEGEVTPVGAFKPVRVDVRVLAATHRPLADMVSDGRFRADLYARLAGFTFQVPPLRERREDLGELLAAFARSAAKEARLRPDAFIALFEHDFPLNVRELKQSFETSLVLAEAGVVRLGDLPDALQTGRSAGRSTAPPAALGSMAPEDEALRTELAQRLDASGYNLSQVAREMGKARQQVQRWVRRFGLKKD